MKKKLLAIIALALPLWGSGGFASAQQLAFPEAQGWGRFATGGRYGTVYHVTNLNDSGAGSLRDAVSQKNRIVVFDVAGVIKLNSRMTFAANIYLAGQTAPGEGITVYGDGVSFSGANNMICRYMRFRMGAGGASGKDCAGVANGTNMIFDHCSFAWGRDETFSINSDGKGDLHSITLQHCVVGQGLMSHSAGGLMQADNITLLGNFYCDNTTRNNKVKGRNQYVNNIVYNWKDGAYIMGGESEGQSYCNIVGNLFVNGPGGGGNAFTGGNSNFHCYVKDNLQDKDCDGKLNATAVTNFSGADLVATPYDYPELGTYSASSIISSLDHVGASFPYRDYVDYYMVDEAKSFGKEGAFISNEASLPYGIPTTWKVWQGTKPVDTDKDGIPDEWEKVLGTDPNKNDAMTIAENGYANIENYLNQLPYMLDELTYLRSPMLVEQTAATTTTLQLKWRDWTVREKGFIVETKTADGDWTEAARTEANTTSVKLTGLQPGTTYTVRIRAWGKAHDTSTDIVYSDYSEEKVVKTNPIEEGIVDIDTYEPDAVWKRNGSGIWDKTTAEWNTADGRFQDGMKVLIEHDATFPSTIKVDEEVAPACVVVVVNQESLTLSGEPIGGTGSMNKAGEGTLTLEGRNTYTGGIVVQDGTLAFTTLLDGGQPSAFGASDDYAKNWVFAGGKYLYKGTKTTTNRCARLLKDGELSTSGTAAVLTMNGTFEGSGNFTFSGRGTLQPNTTHFFGYTGATILAGGTLHLPNAEIANKGIGSSSKLVFAGGTLSTKGENEGYENYTFPIEVREGTTSQFSPHRNCYMKSTVTGAGTLQLNIPYVREYIQGNWDGFTGRLIGNGTSSGNLFLLSGKNIPNGVVVLKNGARACGWDTTGNYTLGGLSGDAGTYLSGSSKQTNNFKCAWTIGTANTDETFRGIINNWSCSGSGHVGTVSITKAGTGVWRLTGANEYSGTTTVDGGTLIINGNHTGTGLITVNKNATLGGTGSVAGGVTVKADATIQAGDTLVTGRKTLTIKGKLTVSRNGIVSIPLSMTDATTVKNNTLVLSGGASFTGAILRIEAQDTTSVLDLPADTELKIYSPNGTITGSFTEIQPATPGIGKLWDTTDLLKKGILRVVIDESVGIDAPNAPTSQQDTYDLGGRRVNPATLPRGLYIRDGKIIHK